MTGILLFLDNMSMAICIMSVIALIGCITIYVERHETGFPFLSERYAFERKRSKLIIAVGLACMAVFCAGWGFDGISDPYRKIVKVVVDRPVEPNAVRVFNECLQQTRLGTDECRARAETIARLTPPTCLAENHKELAIKPKEVAEQ